MTSHNATRNAHDVMRKWIGWQRQGRICYRVQYHNVEEPASPDRVTSPPQGRPVPTLNERDRPPAPDDQVLESEGETVSGDTSIMNDQEAAVSNRSPYFFEVKKIIIV